LAVYSFIQVEKELSRGFFASSADQRKVTLHAQNTSSAERKLRGEHASVPARRKAVRREIKGAYEVCHVG